jgi:beta-glucosidase
MSESGVIPSGKHYILNEIETNRAGGFGGGGPGGPGGGGTGTTTEAYTANSDDKPFHETYLAPFYEAIYNGLGELLSRGHIFRADPCSS